MAFKRPSITTLYDRNAADIESELPGTDARLRRSLANVIARMMAGVAHGLYGYLDYIGKQSNPKTAEDQALDDWAFDWNLTRKQAAPSIGNVALTGTDTTAIPINTLVQRADSTQFITTVAGVISGGVATVAVAGVAGGINDNTAVNTSLTLVTPIAGIDSACTVATGGLVGGTDIETDAELSTRLLTRIQKTPQGGAEIDYINWALEVDGVTRVWVFPLQNGPGTVGVTFVLDNSVPIIPNGSKVTEVQNYIDTLRPVTANVTVFAPVAQTLDFTIQLTPNTVTVQAAVKAELEDLILREGGPGQTIFLSAIREAISTALGETDHTLTIPTANVVVPNNEIFSIGTITWL